MLQECSLPWLFDALPWSKYNDQIVICIPLDIWMILTLTSGFAGTIRYEFYWDPYDQALALRNKVGKEEKVTIASRKR